ncbi:MAG: 4-(cytidine 5'-diphospho)-2-C-methyl-D-erythritol kinase, partial [Candidatus Poribacteria bacterium]|nr:4-(cytidine 5'-diphospho)-2-C-methyl-D-erythritol kinase [Candidatus Poribacteria bacterium]
MIRLNARAKINLYLDVLGRMPSGYHAIETLFQSIDLADTLEVEKASVGVEVRCDDPGVPLGDANLVAKAARAFFGFTGIDGGVVVRLTKRIPMGGGLGGGSADAAGTLVALNQLYKTHFPIDTLERIGATLGADVPFCVRGGTAWGIGAGTALTRVDPLPPYHVLVVNPGVHVDTGWAYRALGLPFLGASNAIDDVRLDRPHPNLPLRGEGTRRVIRLTTRADGVRIVGDWATRSPDRPAWNAFESVVFEAHPVLRTIRDALRDHGAFALMSGSGATVFGAFDSHDAMRDAAESFRGRYHTVVETTF